MFGQFFSIGIIILFSAMSPGPDFAIVAKNTLLHSRRAGIATSLGITSAIIVHLTYCILGLALIISESVFIFNLIKYIGAAYLIYVGAKAFFSKSVAHLPTGEKRVRQTDIPTLTAYWQGFICNLFNPKATLFFLALFTVIIKPQTPKLWMLAYALELLVIVTCWFVSLTLLLSHPYIMRQLDKAEKYINKLLGVFLIGFGVLLAFI